MQYSALQLPDLVVCRKTLFSRQYILYPELVSILLAEFDAFPSPFFSGFEPYKFCKRDKRTYYFDLAVHLLTEYEKNGPGNWKHEDQRKVLEKAIRLLEKASGLLADDGGGRDVALERGKAFLYRSRIIKPKGLTVPGKKIEALEKAMAELSASSSAEAPHYKGLAALEMDRCKIAPPDLTDILEKATANVNPRNLDAEQKKVEFFQMRIRLEELKKGDWGDKILTAVFSVKSRKLDLEKLKTAILTMGKKPSTTLPELQNKLLATLKGQPFSHPLWEDAVRFLRWVNRTVCLENQTQPAPKAKVLERMESFQKSFPIALWKAAEEMSRQLSDIHLRWYWSRQRDLYDLAFLSAVDQKNYALAAQIADSAKSRPALTWQVLEQMSRADVKLKDVIEQYAKVLGGGYVTGMKLHAPAAEEVDAPDFPEKARAGVQIVQFYLVHLQDFEKGCAVICDENGWTDCKFFDFQPIWRRYLQWQTDYFSIPSGNRHLSAPALKKLCEKMGEQLGFLFDFSKGTDILFIPHDFLHRVPLHGAIRDNEILFKKRDCKYIQALWINQSKRRALVENGKNGPSLLLQYLDPEKEALKAKRYQIIMRKADYSENSTNMAKSTDVINALMTNPKVLALRCHGKANTINPFFSKLLLEDRGLDLLALCPVSQTNMQGTAVLLGACETDLMAPIDSPIDENISLAFIFLLNGANRVVGTMWETLDDHVRTLLLKKSKFEENPQNSFKDFLQGLKMDLNNEKSLYDGLCFRFFDTSDENGIQ